MAKLIFSWLVVTLLGFGIIGAVVLSTVPRPIEGVDVTAADGLTFAALYAGLFLFVLGLVVLIGYEWRWQVRQTIYPADHWQVLRQAALVALGSTFLMVLKGLHVLTWWDGALLVIALALIELSFRVRPTVLRAAQRSE